MPTKGFNIPTGFSPPRDSTPDTDSTEDMDYDMATQAAFREWEDIRASFEIFKSCLGPDFEPMGPDLATPEMTPFGPALLYRTLSIAGIWLNYYMGLIALQRAHPAMPPVAMIAAGMSAAQTAPWAYTIARIAAGLHEDTSHVSAVSTLVGAAFIESGFCLFVAGIQVCLSLSLSFLLFTSPFLSHLLSPSLPPLSFLFSPSSPSFLPHLKHNH